LIETYKNKCNNNNWFIILHTSNIRLNHSITRLL